MKSIYKSLPVTGYNLEERKEAARKVKRKLLNEGWAVYNPLDKSNVSDDAPRSVHMREDLKLLLKCDAICMLPGWNNSNGCNTELRVAQECGMEIYYESYETN